LRGPRSIEILLRTSRLAPAQSLVGEKSGLTVNIHKKDFGMKIISVLTLVIFAIGSAFVQADEQAAFLNNSFTPESAADFKFVVMGDNRPWVTAEDVITQNEHFLSSIKRANASEADFAVIVGDLIRGYDNPEMTNKMWDAYDETCKRFKIPYVSVVGNHDVWDKQSQDIWRQRYGRLYFSWDHKGCHFISINSEIVGQLSQITGQQLKWLEQDLKKASGKARHIFVFLHKPLWAESPPNRRSEFNPQVWNDNVHPLLAKYGVDTVFAGHHHEYCMYPAKDGVRYIVTGGAGAEHDGFELAGQFFHQLIVKVSGNSSNFAVITEHGEVPSDYVTPKKKNSLDKLIEVGALQSIPKDGRISIPIRLTNPTGEPIKALVQWENEVNQWQLNENISWEVEDIEINVAPNSTRKINLNAHIDGRFVPVPKLKITFVNGQRVLYGEKDLQFDMISKVGRFITEWNIAGPFDLGIKNMAKVERTNAKEYLSLIIPAWNNLLPPERKIDLTATYKGKGGKKIGWQTVKAEDWGWNYVDIEKLYDDNVFALACAVAYIYAPKAGIYDMSVGSNDSVVVRINGKEVWRNLISRGAYPDADMFSTQLDEGWNEVVLKVLQWRNEWALIVRVFDPDSALKFSTTPR
jgi:predicted phosphodiesterase